MHNCPQVVPVLNQISPRHTLHPIINIINIINIIIIIIIITILYYTLLYFTQDIYNYVPETNHVSRVYNVAAVLYLQFVLHVMLLRP